MKLMHNEWPCCKRPTGFKSALYHAGDEVTKKCGKDGRTFKIKFEAITFAGMDFLKMIWTEVGGRNGKG